METPIMHRDQLLTAGHLYDFKTELLQEIAKLIEQRGNAPVKQWLRTSEVREIMGVSRGTLQTLRIGRKISFSKIGGIVFYRYEDVMALLEKNCVPKAEHNG